MSTRRRRNCAGARSRFPKEPTDFVEGIVNARRQWRRGDAGRHGGPRLRRQPFDDRLLLLQCRRRNADRAAAGPRALRHRARRDRGAAGRDRRDPARACAFASSCPTARRAATSARITVLRCGCRNSGRSARTVSPIRAISSALLPLTKTPRRLRADREIPGQSLDGGDGSFAAQCRRLAWQFRAVQIRAGALHGDRHSELRSSRSVDL